jgi:anhydro-N-acetylmuramic acid kinase
MTVAGIMSGTSADGIDVALVRIVPGIEVPRLRLLSHFSKPYPATIRKRVMSAMNASNQSVADLSRLHWRLGQLYAEAVTEALKNHPVKLDLIGCHGQTLYHQANPSRYLGTSIACTWQIGEAAVIAAQTGIPVVSDFRPADIAVGGQGAPLVPLLDWVYFHHVKRNRVLQNLGGIGNLTVIPSGTQPGKIFAFDTGPANMVIDAIVDTCFHKRYDRNGAIAASGRVLDNVLKEFLPLPYFSAPPPKSAGREEFGREFAARFLARCRKTSTRPEDAVATATAFTACTIRIAWKRFVQPALHDAPTDFIVAGGGAKNPVLMRMLALELAPFRISISGSDHFGLPTEAKEAVAFALLAYQTWHHMPGNIPEATGATRPAMLGKISYA